MKTIESKQVKEFIEMKKQKFYSEAENEIESIINTIDENIKLYNDKSYINIYDREYEYKKNYSTGFMDFGDGDGNNEYFISETDYIKFKLKNINDPYVVYIQSNNEKFVLWKINKDEKLKDILEANEILLLMNVITYPQYLEKYYEVINEYSKKNDFNDPDLNNENFEYDKYILLEKENVKRNKEFFFDETNYIKYYFTEKELKQRSRKQKLNKLNKIKC